MTKTEIKKSLELVKKLETAGIRITDWDLSHMELESYTTKLFNGSDERRWVANATAIDIIETIINGGEVK